MNSLTSASPHMSQDTCETVKDHDIISAHNKRCPLVARELKVMSGPYWSAKSAFGGLMNIHSHPTLL